jgi:hypothetical protein
MNNTIKIAAACASAFTLSLALSGAVRADAVAPKTLVENEKVLVAESILKPGDTAPSGTRVGQVFYYVQGGSVEVTYSDGKKETFQRKTGTARIVTKASASAMNVGKTTIHVVSVTLK